MCPNSVPDGRVRSEWAIQMGLYMHSPPVMERHSMMQSGQQWYWAIDNADLEPIHLDENLSSPLVVLDTYCRQYSTSGAGPGDIQGSGAEKTNRTAHWLEDETV